MTATPIEKCSTCKFYNLSIETQFGLVDDAPLDLGDYESECRRFPPVRCDVEYAGSMIAQDVLCDKFGGPIVNAHGWCGEWRGTPGVRP